MEEVDSKLCQPIGALAGDWPECLALDQESGAYWSWSSHRCEDWRATYDKIGAGIV
jgi:hypothetical protein